MENKVIKAKGGKKKTREGTMSSVPWLFCSLDPLSNNKRLALMKIKHDYHLPYSSLAASHFTSKSFQILSLQIQTILFYSSFTIS